MPSKTTSALLERWRQQITIVQPREALREIAKYMQTRKPGAYLRFGDGDVRLLAGADDVLQKQSAALTSEMQETLLLEGNGIFKALALDCPGLGLQPGMRHHLFGMTDDEALNMLWHAGRYFIGKRIYPHSALAYLSVFDPQAAVEFLAVLRSFRPLYVGNEYTAPALIQMIFGHSGHVPTPSRDAYDQIDRIEPDIWKFVPWLGDYPVVVLAMGCAGRPLAKRLIQKGFGGFIFDFGSLLDALSDADTRDWITSAPRHPRQILTMKWPKMPAPGPYMRKANHRSPEAIEHSVCWEGPQLLHHSFAVINRELCIRLACDPRVDLTLSPRWPHQFTPDADKRFRLLHERFFQPLAGAIEITVRHKPWPDFEPPREGHWVTIQPWEYPNIPRNWIAPMQNDVDEVWVHSQFVFDCYVRGGLSPDRLQYIPLAANTEIFGPHAPPMELDTTKKFRFVFVGGTQWRKGSDILIKAYHKAFAREDDVCLVIKDFGKKTFYMGSTYKALLDEQQKRRGAPEVLYMDPMLSDGELAGLYTACDCLVHPYRAEGFGLPIAEAMACGLPVIVTGHGPSRDFVSEATGYLLPATIAYMKKHWPDVSDKNERIEYAEPDEDALIQTMRYVVDHQDEARAKGLAGSQAIRTNWTWERSAQAVIERFRALKTMPIRRGSKS